MMPNPFIFSSLQVQIGALGLEGSYSLYRILYGLIGIVIFLAMMNSLLVLSVGFMSLLGYRNRLLSKMVATLYVALLVVQAVIGLAPLVLICRALATEVSWSFGTYGMPLLQFFIVAFCLFYQVKLLKIYSQRYISYDQSAHQVS